MLEVFEEILIDEHVTRLEQLIDDIFMNPSNNFGIVLGDGENRSPDGWWMQHQLTHYIDKSVPNLYDDLVDNINAKIEPFGKEVDALYLTFLDRGQSIIWHNDLTAGGDAENNITRGFRINHERRTGAMTIYLNREWKQEWGGIMKYGHQNWHDEYLPRFNTGILFDQTVRHCVTKIESPGRDRSHDSMRKTLQIWVRDA
jgi:hypothetical protein